MRLGAFELLMTLNEIALGPELNELKWEVHPQDSALHPQDRQHL